MSRSLLVLLLLLSPVATAFAQVKPFSPVFQTKEVTHGDATLHVRVGGRGPAVVLIHGFGDTGDMWAPLANALAAHHTVVVPDLRGMGLSSHPDGGYDKKTQAGDIRAILDALHLQHAVVVGHDIGTMVAFAYAANYPRLTDKLVVMDAPVPGIPPWDEIVRNPLLWHFDFGGPDMERLVSGRERIYLDRFWNEFAGDPSKLDEGMREHYAGLYAQPGAMHSAFSQFRSFRQDAKDNQPFIAHKLTMPVLAIGGGKSFGEGEAAVMRNAATDVTGLVVPESGHWLMEEATATTVAAISDFIDGPKAR